MNLKIKITALCLSVATIAANPLFAQSNKNAATLSKAENQYKALKYANAIPLLLSVVKNEPTNVKALALLANANRKVKNYTEAEIWYGQLLKNSTEKPEWALAYAEVLANNKKYSQSEIWYKNYVAATAKGAGAYHADAPNVGSFMQNKNSWKVGFTNLNTAQSEYAPLYFKNGLLFVSNRTNNALVKNVFAWDGTPFSNLYWVKDVKSIALVNVDSILLAAKEDKSLKGKLNRINNDDTRRTSNDSRTFVDAPLVLNDTLAKVLGADKIVSLLHGKVNTKYHEGPAALLPDGSLMFTRNNYFNGKAKKDSKGVINLKMYTASANSLDDVKPFAFNNDEYSVGHPALNAAGTVLIFSSNMPGGFGGTDLYYSTRLTAKDNWSQPINLGPSVNTTGDEMFPTIYQDNTLFFSSTGHGGLGGLDIFQIALNNATTTGSPINLGSPVNSSVDDFSLVRSANGNSGFFTSNRRGNDDIFGFSFDDNAIVLKGFLVDNKTKKPLTNAKVNLLYGGQNLVLTTDSLGRYTYIFNKNTVAKLDYEIAGYASKTTTINTNTDAVNQVIEQHIFLEPALGSLANITPADVKNCETVKAAIKDFVLYYDLDKSVIREDASLIADQVALFLKQNPDLEVYAASHTDSRASKTYNLKLAERRADAAKQYLVNRGINASRIKIAAFGEEKLLNYCADNVDCTEEQQQLNRRTEFIFKYKGKKLSDLDCSIIKQIIK